MSSRFADKLAVFMQLTDSLAALSCCKRMGVGSIVIPRDFTEVLSIGFNGPPRGLPNDSCTCEDPCGCVHAEANAVAKLDTRGYNGLVLLCTHPPCWRCAGLIVNKRTISHVLYWNGHPKSDGLAVLQAAGVYLANHHKLQSIEAWWSL